MIRPWPLLEQQCEFDTRIFRLVRRQSASPRTGRVHDFYVLETPDWVNVIPLTDDNQVVMVRQYRHGRREETLEIPGGMLDPMDLDPLTAAQRELLEETGYQASSLTAIGSISPNPAMQNNLCHSFVARGLDYRGPQQLDGAEDIDIQLVPLDQIPALIKQAKIVHALVVVAFAFLGVGVPSTQCHTSST
jgi:ADP-ribose pyrophosphatase